MSIASALSGFVPPGVKQVLEALMLAVDAFWQDNRLPTKKAVGVTQRLLWLQTRLDVLLERFRAGKVRWRKQPPRVARVVEPEAGADADLGDEDAPRPPRAKLFGLPAYFGWLGQEMPNVAVMLGSDLEAAFKTDEMRALMQATPEVARLAGPVFRMLGLNDALLLVPDGYTGPGLPKNRHFHKPVPRRPKWVSEYVAPMVVPPDYVEERDGRKPHPLRDPYWNFAAYRNYRAYLYDFMRQRPKYPQMA